MNIKQKKILKICSLSILGLFILFFLFRNTLLSLILKHKIQAFESHYHTHIEINNADFKGINGILLNGIRIAPGSSDTLLKIDSIFLNIRLFPLLSGKIRFSNLEISNSNFHLIKRKQGSNFSFLLKHKKTPSDSIVVKADYSRLAEQILTSLFDVIPASVRFKNTVMTLESDSLQVKAFTPFLYIKDHIFNTKVIFIENEKVESWVAQGSIYSDERRAELKIFPERPSSNELPVFKQKWKLSITFDTLRFSLNEVSYVNEGLKLKGSISAINFQLNHWRISPNNVIIKNQAINYSCRVGSNYIAMDSTSSVTYNKVTYHPYVKLQIYPTRQFQLDMVMPECKSQDFFESFPAGLFENIDGIKTSGSLSYRLHFFIDTHHPDDLQFSSGLIKKNFKILGFGKSALTKINSEFQYTAYEKERAVRTFEVGLSNPNYTPIAQISNSLKAALLTSEDGNFYSHNGFNEEAFRKSISTNFKEGRFVRGGSTISMQLVKNVFLTRNKTVARKIEEALVVWLIENNRLVSKERMYEVYLNIIEWGPNVYGIGEASRFYFEKSPAELTLAESIFLAMIVPRPKGFRYNFGADGKLRESAAGYYNLVASHMVKKGVLTEDEKNSLLPNVELKGIAKSMVLVSDTTTLPAESDDEFIIVN